MVVESSLGGIVSIKVLVELAYSKGSDFDRFWPEFEVK